MKKNLLKVLSVCLASAMLLTSMSACKKNGGGSDSGEAFVPTEALELTVWNTQGTDYSPAEVYETDIVAKWLKEKTMTEVVNIYGNGGGQWDTKLSQLAVADDLPDIIFCSSGQGATHFSKINEMGQLNGLTEEMIQQYAPEVWKRTPASYWDDLRAEDGTIMGIPFSSKARDDIFAEDTPQETIDFIKTLTIAAQSDVAFSPNTHFWVRDDVLKMVYPEAKSYNEINAILEEKQAPVGEELLDIPIYSTQEFVDFMYKVRDLNLKENGKTVYAFGYDGGDNWSALTYFGSDMVGYKTRNYAGTWNTKTEKYEIPLVHDMIKEAARTQNQLVNDKVIDPESLMHTSSQFKEKILNGRYAIAPIQSVDQPIKINSELEARGVSYRFRPFITQVSALEGYEPYTSPATWVNSICFTTKLSEDELKQALNWVNVQYTAEYDKVRNWGPEEAGLYEETEDGKLIFKDENFNKYFIEGDSTAIADEKDRLGLGGTGGMLMVVPVNVDRYNPMVMHEKLDLTTPRLDKAYKFESTSKHITSVQQLPTMSIWDPPYAEVEGVVEFWAKRESWESEFKKAMAAAPGEFDAKWDAAVASINEICDVAKMEEGCTEVYKGLLADMN